MHQDTSSVKINPVYFHLQRHSLPVIRLIKSMRKSDPRNCYVPMGNLYVPEYERAWKQIDFAHAKYDARYIEDCLRPIYTYEKAMTYFCHREPFLKNTVFIKHKNTEKLEDRYSIFLVQNINHEFCLRELYQATVLKQINRMVRSCHRDDQEIVDQDQLVFTRYSFDGCKEGNMTHYSHRFHYRSADSNRECVKSLLANIIAG